MGFLFYQHGLHPYLNALLNFLLSGALIYFAGDALDALPKQVSLYRYFHLSLMIVLTVQTILQLFFLENANLSLTLATLSSSLLLLLIFGLLIPRILPLDSFIRGLGILCAGLCAASLAAYLIGFPMAFKGNRFIGIFKHIPYMVTCASVGFIFLLRFWPLCQTWLERALLASSQLVCLFALFLTGTRSALFAVILAAALFFALYPSQNLNFRMARVLTAGLFATLVILFGSTALQFTEDLLTGEVAIGSRDAQDGVSDRLDEVYRGLEILEKSPHLGMGLLSKFGGENAEEAVGSYNSFQDPHNLIISAAVIGGWPLAVIICLGFLVLCVGCLRFLWYGNPSELVLAAYLLSHAPILFIYHAHLSLGGLADRLYWLCFAYLGMQLIILQFSPDKMKKLY